MRCREVGVQTERQLARQSTGERQQTLQATFSDKAAVGRLAQSFLLYLSTCTGKSTRAKNTGKGQTAGINKQRRNGGADVKRWRVRWQNGGGRRCGDTKKTATMQDVDSTNMEMAARMRWWAAPLTLHREQDGSDEKEAAGNEREMDGDAVVKKAGEGSNVERRRHGRGDGGQQHR
eukprot:CAMPEP_0196666422 /NCGR_PEP_ID=MMETSP1086-20130531/64504_1 /TAXON_ID=77921 /ORGANISM="Cyanoptyche  gloeocystis , Strain SAG4.97" /LENGTH=175 /DNA_ID=CAMNT_0042003611 /DNA_START=957 /DNA_END=1485 /DNA_ORIENTATION=-